LVMVINLMAQRAILDSDVVSGLMRKRPLLVANAGEYLKSHPNFTISIMSRFEVLRGLKVRNSLMQAEQFEGFCAVCDILPITEEVVVRAADMYASLYKIGRLIGDADILIAATALTQGLAVVTNNIDHFNRIEGLTVVNWGL